MTEDKARKTAARERMAQTGEPYSVARRAVENETRTPPDPLSGTAEDAGAGELPPPPSSASRSKAEQARSLAEQARHQAERAEDSRPRRRRKPPT